MDLWQIVATVVGGILTTVVGSTVAAVRLLWVAVGKSHAQHVDCVEGRRADNLRHWEEMEELRAQVGLPSKEPHRETREDAPDSISL